MALQKISVERFANVRTFQMWECDVPQELLDDRHQEGGDKALDDYITAHGETTSPLDLYGASDPDLHLEVTMLEDDPNDAIVEAWRDEFLRTPDHLRNTLDSLRRIGFDLTRKEA